MNLEIFSIALGGLGMILGVFDHTWLLPGSVVFSSGVIGLAIKARK